MKYKKCCQPRTERSRPEAAPPARSRIVRYRSRELVVPAERDSPSGALGEAASFFDEKDRGEDPAARLARFAAPLTEAAHGDPARLEKALTLGTLLWNLALLGGEEREGTIAQLVRSKTDADAAELRTVAEAMFERHRQMFPVMYRERAGTTPPEAMTTVEEGSGSAGSAAPAGPRGRSRL